MDEIQLLHPDGKRNFKITKEKYELVKDAILKCLKIGELTHTELLNCVEKSLPTFDGNVSWYLMSVKLDLEARGSVMRIPRSRPQRYGIKLD